jgi:SWIM zinc finger
LAENFKKKFGEEKSIVLKQLASVYCNSDMNEFKTKLMEGGDELMDWIIAADPETWCRSLSPIPRFGVTTSNTIEIVFSTFKKAKHLPFLHLFLYIEKYILIKKYLAYERYKKMVLSGELLVTKAEKILSEASELSRNLCCSRTDELTATDDVYHSQRERQSFTENIAEKTCTCGKYQELKIPCHHAISFIRGCLNENPNKYCSDMYHVSNVMSMYKNPGNQQSIATTINDLYNIGRMDIIPPVVQPRRGRKRKNQIESKSKGKPSKSTQYIPRRCPLYLERGHFQKNCEKFPSTFPPPK